MRMSPATYAIAPTIAILFTSCSGSTTPSTPTASQPSQSQRITNAVQSPPPAGWQFPYQPNPFNVAICASDPCYPQLDPKSASEVSQMMNGSFSMGEIQEAQPGTNGQGEAGTDPVYYATQSDPTYTVRCTNYGGCPFFSGVSIHIPNGAHASIDVDHHATVIELWAGTEYDFSQFNDHGTGTGTTTPLYGGGALSVGFGGLCRTNSLQNHGRCQGGANEAAVPMQPGRLDPREIVAGTIKHTVYIGVICPSPQYVWPAAQSGGRCPSGPAEGERVWLDLSNSAIDALPDHTWVKTLLHQMHDYGLMVTDSTGSSPTPWGFSGLDNATFTIVGEQPAWNAFFTEVENEGDANKINWGDNASHLDIPTTGIRQSNIHIVE